MYLTKNPSILRNTARFKHRHFVNAIHSNKWNTAQHSTHNGHIEKSMKRFINMDKEKERTCFDFVLVKTHN